ncbi:MAG: hypothetical protein NTV43_02070 [Methylococcales bacterium]|nr:hypothetical protein [Methylococcales bacterium]
MQVQNVNTAQSLYALYETLSNETQQQFLQELMQKQADKLETLALYIACQEAKGENEFLSDDEATEFINSLPQ